MGLSVTVYDNFDKALRKFKKKVNDDGILETARAKMFYEKPSVKRSRKKAAAKSRQKRLTQLEKDIGITKVD